VGIDPEFADDCREHIENACPPARLQRRTQRVVADSKPRRHIVCGIGHLVADQTLLAIATRWFCSTPASPHVQRRQAIAADLGYRA
jgi:hypothetical protein